MKHSLKTINLDASFNLSKLKELFFENDLELSPNQCTQFEDYYKALLNWNPKANLISKKDENRVLGRHFLESARLALLGEFEEEFSVLDLGAGGGFPGVPLKIVRPQLHLVLLDSKRWKGLFLKSLVEQLQLQNVEVICDRAEALLQRVEYLNRFDRIVTRAVAELHDLCRFSSPLLKREGKIVAIKGSNLEQEVGALKSKFLQVTIEIKHLPGSQPSQKKQQRVVIVGNVK